METYLGAFGSLEDRAVTRHLHKIDEAVISA